MREFFEQLDRRAKITRYARFEAARRMRRCKISSTVMLAMLSFYIICFNILQLIPRFKVYDNAISGVTICLSVLVLIMSLLVSYIGYSDNETKYQRCAMDLHKLSSRYGILIKNEDNLTSLNQIVSDYNDEYHHLLAECDLNHQYIDMLRAYNRIENNTGSSEKLDWEKWWKNFYSQKIVPPYPKIVLWWRWNVFDVNMFYWAMTFLIPFIAGFVIFCSDPIWKGLMKGICSL